VPHQTQHSVQRIGAVNEGEDWFSPSSDLLQRPADAHIVARGNESLLECLCRIAITSSLMKYPGEIQVELRVIPLDSEGLTAQALAIGKALLGHRNKHSHVGKIEGIPGLPVERATGV
jgi:hypothetical protein